MLTNLTAYLVVADSRDTRYLNYDALGRSVCFLSDCDRFVTLCGNLLRVHLGPRARREVEGGAGDRLEEAAVTMSR
jgi:hypothetical protein